MKVFNRDVAVYGALYAPVLVGDKDLGDGYVVVKSTDARYNDLRKKFGKLTHKGKKMLHTSIQSAVDVASRGDVIRIFPGEYDETVSVKTSNIILVGMGGRGSVAVAPSEANGTALTVDGDTDQVTDVTLINLGLEADGTGSGLHLKGDVRRVRAYGCKIEGGTDSLKLESTANGALADNRFEDCEIAWGTNGVHITASGAGDPVTQTVIRGCLFHNQTTDVIKTSVSHTVDLWLYDNVFAAQEDGTEPTQYLDIDEASTTGIVAGNKFQTTVWDTASFALAAGVLFVGNYAEAEGPATGGGTSGRPD